MRNPAAVPSSAHRVKTYLVEEFLRPELEAGTRLPPVRTLARQLGVSSATVHQAYRELTEEGTIITGVGRGTFLAGKPKIHTDRPVCLGISVFLPTPRPENMWTFEVCQSILAAAARHHRAVSILPLSPSESEKTPFAEVLSGERHLVDGLIAFPVPRPDLAIYDQVFREYEMGNKPVVSIFPSRLNATKNFVSPDFFAMGKAVARAMAKAGRRKLLFLCSGDVHLSISLQLRLAGLIEGFSESGLDPMNSVSLVDSGSVLENAGEEVITDALNRKVPFDCIFSFGPFLAAGALAALEKAGINVPDDISVVTDSFQTSTAAKNRRISGLMQPIEALGEQAIGMLLQRISAPREDCAGRYLPVTISPGDTLTPSEEKFLAESLD